MYIHSPRSSPVARGFTLVELMVALAIGLLMAFGLVRVFASSSDSYRALAQASQQIENGRYAIQVISEDLRHAGFYGEYSFAPVATGAAPDPCEKDNLVLLRDARVFHVQGYDGVFPHACIAAANVEPGTDILVVRRAHTTTTALGAMSANEVYMQAIADSYSTANPIIELGSQPANFTLTKKDAATLADIRKYHVHIYFVSRCSEPAGATCTAADDGGRNIPTLKRLSLGIDAAGTRVLRLESIAEGIERLQVDFGEDTLPVDPNLRDGVPDGAYKNAASVVQWGDVMAAQIFVLARTPDPTLGVADAKTYNLGTLGAYTPGGPFRRHLFTSQVRLVNPAGRREVP